MEAAQRSRLSLWMQAVRAFSFPASVTPVLVGAALAAARAGNADWRLLPLILPAAVLLHAGANVINDYYDFVRGVDQKDSYGSSRVLVDGLMEPAALRAGGLGLLAAGCLLGLALVAVRGLPMLALGAAGALGGYAYTGAPFGYKYCALGDAMVFLLMGPLMVVGAYFALTGGCDPAVWLASLPVGCLVTAILCANNLRDVRHDSAAGVKTLATVFGARFAKGEYVALTAGAYGCAGALAAARVVSPWALLALLTVPFAVRNARLACRGRQEDLVGLDVRTAQLHLLFGLLYAGGIFA